MAAVQFWGSISNSPERGWCHNIVAGYSVGEGEDDWERIRGTKRMQVFIAGSIRKPRWKETTWKTQA
jgi:hypothetical protein